MLYCNGQIELPFEQFRRFVRLSGRSTALVRSVALCNYKRGGLASGDCC